MTCLLNHIFSLFPYLAIIMTTTIKKKFFFQSQQIAQIYLLIMKRIQERDIDFIGAERIRLQQLLDGKISEQKKKEINQKLNILSAFNVAENEQRNEL